MIFPPFFYNPPIAGLDASWNIALYLAFKYHLVFGKDFVFTYGPLGILNTRHPIGINLLVYLLFDIYFLFTMFLVLKEVFKKHFNFGVILFIFLCITIAMYDALDQWFFFFFLFYLFAFLKEPSRLAFVIQAAVMSIMCFYYKVSLGMVAIIIFLLGMGYMLIRNKLNYKVCAGVILSYLLAIWLSAQFLHVDLKGYIVTSLQFINDYNDAMFRAMSGEYRQFFYGALFIILISAVLILCWLGWAIRKKEIFKRMDDLFIYGITALALFVLFKSAFVRTDGHIYIFYKSIGLTVVFLYLYSPQGVGRKIGGAYCCLVMIIAFWAANVMPGSYQPYRRIINFSFLSIKGGEVGQYFRGLVHYNKALAQSDKLGSENNAYKGIIGDHSVDIIPEEISKIYFNGLRYDPRPVIQSYAAYNGYLDSLNYQKYMSAGAPDYILFSMSSVDDRFPFFDESKTKLAIFDRYEVAGQIGDDLLLRKKEVTGSLKQSGLTDTTDARLGEDIPIREGIGLQYSKIFVRYDLRGRMERLFYQPPALKITFTLDNGETSVYQAIKPILAGGVILNKYVDSKQDFQVLMQSDGRLSSNVRKIRIEPASPGAGFEKDIRLVNTYYTFHKSDPERIADSLGIANLIEGYNRHKLTLLDPSLYFPEKFLIGVGFFKAHAQFINVDGWAFREGSDNRKLKLSPVLRFGDSIYALPREKKERSDVGAYFNRKDLANAGFVSTVSKTQLPPGDYQFGVALFDADKGRGWICYTEEHTLIRGDHPIEKISSIDMKPCGDEKLSYFIDAIENQEDRILIRGWAYVKGMDSKLTPTNLVLQGNEGIYRVRADMIQRTDLVAAFKDPLVEYSGFSVLILKSALSRVDFLVGIEKVFPGGKERSLSFGDSKIRISPEMYDPVPTGEMPPVGDLYIGMDFVKDDDTAVTVSGWAVDEKEMSRVAQRRVEIILQSDRSIYVSPTDIKLRPDVTAFFKHKFDLDKCGFIAKISKKALPAGKYRIGIHVFQKGEKGEVKFIDQSCLKK